MQKITKVAKSISLSEDMWNKIDAVKSPEINRTSFIGLAVEEYIQKHHADKLAAYMATGQ